MNPILHVRNGLACLLLAFLCALVYQGIQLEKQATEAARALPGVVTEQAYGIRLDLVAQLAAAREQAAAQLARTGADAVYQVAAARIVADKRIGDSLARVDTALAQTGPVMAQASATLEAAQPVLDNLSAAAAGAAGLEAQSTRILTGAEAAWSDNEYELYNLLSSSEVMVAGMGQTADIIARVTPEIAKSTATTAAAVAREADVLTKPKHWYEKILGPVYTIGRLVACFL